MFQIICDYLRQTFYNVPINIVTDLGELTPKLAQKMIESAQNTNRIWNGLTIFGTIFFVSLGLIPTGTACQEKQKRHHILLGLFLFATAAFIATSRIHNYRYFQNIELPKLQAIANSAK